MAIVGYTPALGDVITLIDNESSQPVQGLFQTAAGQVLKQGAVATFSGLPCWIRSLAAQRATA